MREQEGQFAVGQREPAHEIRVDEDGAARERDRAMAEIVDKEDPPRRPRIVRKERRGGGADCGHHSIEARVPRWIAVQKIVLEGLAHITRAQGPPHRRRFLFRIRRSVLVSGARGCLRETNGRKEQQCCRNADLFHGPPMSITHFYQKAAAQDSAARPHRRRAPARVTCLGAGVLLGCRLASAGCAGRSRRRRRIVVIRSGCCDHRNSDHDRRDRGCAQSAYRGPCRRSRAGTAASARARLRLRLGQRLGGNQHAGQRQSDDFLHSSTPVGCGLRKGARAFSELRPVRSVRCLT